MLHCPIVLLKISPSTVIEVAARNTSAAGSTSSSNSETLKVSKNTDQNHSTEIGGADMHSVSGGQDTVATSSSTQATSSSSSVRPLKKIITNASKCKKMKATHGVIPGSSWGTLSIEKQRYLKWHTSFILSYPILSYLHVPYFPLPCFNSLEIFMILLLYPQSRFSESQVILDSFFPLCRQ